MNTAALKALAPAVRRQLLEAVSRKLDYVLSAQTPDYLTTYAQQVVALRKLAQEDRTGLIERVAYTWFNRFTALRYLDARGWHPFHCRVLTAASAEETQPEVLKLLRNGALPSDLGQHTNLPRLNDLLDARIPSFNAQGEVYRHLVLAACRFYHALLPNVFERLDDETELLLPDDLLTEHSVVQPFRTEISDEDCAEVEIIGWLYQFYISERKDEVMARKSAVPKQDIPSVTQLFTPHWIVRYLVENSLGRLWLLNRPNSRLREKMAFYIEGEPETDFLTITKPEEIRLLDPAAGSGHMLTYAFDLLYAIYEEEGYPASDIPALILKCNLHGLDICPRAAQLAELALLFKAREKSRRFFQPDYLVRPNVMELGEVRFAVNELQDYIHKLGLSELFNERVIRLMYQFEEAKNFGSLIQPSLDHQTISFIRSIVESKDVGSQLFLNETHLKVVRVLEQAEVLTQRYHLVVANPPYMGSGAMNLSLKAFIERFWTAGKSDTYSSFILRNRHFVMDGGSVAMITIPNWMFISTFAPLRALILEEGHLVSLVHCGRGVWGSDFGSCAFILRSRSNSEQLGRFKRLFKRQGEVQTNEALEANFFNTKVFPDYTASSRDFRMIPSYPIAYWASSSVRSAFSEGYLISDFFFSDGLTKTGNNERFLRKVWEVEAAKIQDPNYYRLCVKGGEGRKFYGNCETVVLWTPEARNHYRQDLVARITPEYLWLTEGISWTKVSSAGPTFRRFYQGTIAETGGPAIFANDRGREILNGTLGFLCSKVCASIGAVLNPTLNNQTNDVLRLPIRLEACHAATPLVDEAIKLSKEDYDNCETSKDFVDLGLLRTGVKSSTLASSWRNWEAQRTAVILRMQELERANNRLFIEAYGLQDELSPEVPEEQITLARADVNFDVTAFLSYVVGCMMGRYSLDHPGLILANTGDSMCEFLAKVNLSKEDLTFTPSEDGIIPVLDGAWFENDIVTRTREFLRAAFGEATLRDNIRFIEDSLGKDLRKYFLTDFYKDHLQTYKKRPIYWMVQSPKKSFSVLVYLHRYTRDTMNLVLNRYIREYEVKLRNRIERLVQILADANTTTREKIAARKESDKLVKALHDCEEWERQTLLPLAQARIELDLDDGVKVNYLKLGEALAPIPGLAVVEE